MPESEQRQYNLLLDDLTSLEEYVHDLFSFSPVPICFVSPIGVVLEVNPAMERLSGFRVDEIIGESIEKFFAKEDVKNLVKETLKNGLIEGREMSFCPKSGQGIFVRVSTRIRKDEKNEIVGYFLGFSDLSVVRKTEAELRRVQVALLNILEDTEDARRKVEAEKDKTEAIITNFVDALFFFDSSHHLVLMNPQAGKFFNLSREEVVGHSIQELAGLPELANLIEFLGPGIRPVSRKEFLFRPNFILEVSVIAIASRTRYIGRSIPPAMKQDETDLGDLVVLHDVSREKMVEKLKTEFVSLTAHQLRTPLSAIKWSVKMIIDGDLGAVNQGQKEVLEKTYQSNERMIALINDLLNLARIEEGRYVLSLTRINLVEIFCQAAEMAKEVFGKKKIKFVFKKPVKKTVEVMGDGEKLRLVFQNFLDNAAKYTPASGRVSFSLKESKKEARIEIKDTGIGINEAEKERVFSKFFRTKEATLMEPTGTGLGLYMAKNIVESHHGQIGFESKINQGTTFYFSLPKA